MTSHAQCHLPVTFLACPHDSCSCCCPHCHHLMPLSIAPTTFLHGTSPHVAPHACHRAATSPYMALTGANLRPLHVCAASNQWAMYNELHRWSTATVGSLSASSRLCWTTPIHFARLHCCWISCGPTTMPLLRFKLLGASGRPKTCHCAFH